MKKSHFEAHKELMKQQIQVKIDKLNLKQARIDSLKQSDAEARNEIKRIQH